MDTYTTQSRSPGQQPRAATKLNLLQLRSRIRDLAEKAATLELASSEGLDGEEDAVLTWPLQNKTFMPSSWPNAPAYCGMAALYLARHPSHGSSHFRKWWNANIFHDAETGRKRSSGSKKSQIKLQRQEFIHEILRLWRGEEEEVYQALVCFTGVPNVVKSALESAANTTNDKHKKEILKVSFAFTKASRTWTPPKGIMQLHSMIQTTYDARRGDRAMAPVSPMLMN